LIASGEKDAPVPPVQTGSDGASRIDYPPGKYPKLRLSNGETLLIHSLLNVTHPLAFGDYVWNENGVPPGPVWVRIDLAKQMVSVFRGGDEIGTAVIIYGANSHPTPVGVFAVLEKAKYHFSNAYDAPMPYMLRLTADGVALHASSVRESFATHGCIGTPMEFARLLFGAVRLGDRVAILPPIMPADRGSSGVDPANTG
jgi:hypothetical protein